MRRPPRSTLLPCTTRFRYSNRTLPLGAAKRTATIYFTHQMWYTLGYGKPCKTTENVTRSDTVFLRSRSEEHTSELQSRQYLVCRLLLEQKASAGRRYTAGR